MIRNAAFESNESFGISAPAECATLRFGAHQQRCCVRKRIELTTAHFSLQIMVGRENLKSQLSTEGNYRSGRWACPRCSELKPI